MALLYIIDQRTFRFFLLVTLIVVSLMLVGCRVTIEKPSAGSSFFAGEPINFKAEYDGWTSVKWRNDYTNWDGQTGSLNNDWFKDHAVGIGKGYPWDFSISNLPVGKHHIAVYEGGDEAVVDIFVIESCQSQICATEGETGAWISVNGGEPGTAPNVSFENDYDDQGDISGVTITYEFKGLYYSVKDIDGATNLSVRIPSFANTRKVPEYPRIPFYRQIFEVGTNWDRLSVTPLEVQSTSLGTIPGRVETFNTRTDGIKDPVEALEKEPDGFLVSFSSNVNTYPQEYYTLTDHALVIEDFLNASVLSLAPIQIQGNGDGTFDVKALTKLKLRIEKSSLKSFQPQVTDINKARQFEVAVPNINLGIKEDIFQLLQKRYYIISGRDESSGQWLKDIGEITDPNDGYSYKTLDDFIYMKEDQGYEVVVHTTEEIGIENDDTSLERQCKIQQAILAMAYQDSPLFYTLADVLLVGDYKELPPFQEENSGPFGTGHLANRAFEGATIAYTERLPGNNWIHLKTDTLEAINKVFIYSSMDGAGYPDNPYELTADTPVWLSGTEDDLLVRQIVILFSSPDGVVPKLTLFLCKSDSTDCLHTDSPERIKEITFWNDRGQDPEKPVAHIKHGTGLVDIEINDLLMHDPDNVLDHFSWKEFAIEYDSEELRLKQRSRFNDIPYTANKLSPACVKYIDEGWRPGMENGICDDGEVVCQHTSKVAVCDNGNGYTQETLSDYLDRQGLPNRDMFCLGGRIYSQDDSISEEHGIAPFEDGLLLRGLGRLQASTAVDLGQQLTKTINYQKSSDHRYNRSLLLAGNQNSLNPGPTYKYAHRMFEYLQGIRRSSSYRKNKFYPYTWFSRDLSNARRFEMNRDMYSSGLGLMMYLGHSGEEEDPFNLIDSWRTPNEVEAPNPIVFADSCDTVHLENRDSVALGHMLNRWGASAYIGANDGIGYDFTFEFIDNLVHSRSGLSLGSAFNGTLKRAILDNSESEAARMLLLGDSSMKVKGFYDIDLDSDGIPNLNDICPEHYNPDQNNCDLSRQISQCLERPSIKTLINQCRSGGDGAYCLGDFQALRSCDPQNPSSCNVGILNHYCRNFINAPMCDYDYESESYQYEGEDTQRLMSRADSHYYCHPITGVKSSRREESDSAVIGENLELDSVALAASESSFISDDMHYCVCDYTSSSYCDDLCELDDDLVYEHSRESDIRWQPIERWTFKGEICATGEENRESRHLCNDESMASEQVDFCSPLSDIYVSQRTSDPEDHGVYDLISKRETTWHWNEEMLPKEFPHAADCRLRESVLDDHDYNFTAYLHSKPQNETSQGAMVPFFTEGKDVHKKQVPIHHTFDPWLTAFPMDMTFAPQDASSGSSTFFSEYFGKSPASLFLAEETQQWAEGEPSGLIVEQIIDTSGILFDQTPVAFGMSQNPWGETAPMLKVTAELKYVAFQRNNDIAGAGRRGWILFVEDDEQIHYYLVLIGDDTSGDSSEKPGLTLQYVGKAPFEAGSSAYHWEENAGRVWKILIPESSGAPKTWTLNLDDVFEAGDHAPIWEKQVSLADSDLAVSLNDNYRMASSITTAKRLYFYSPGDVLSPVYHLDLAHGGWGELGAAIQHNPDCASQVGIDHLIFAFNTDDGAYLGEYDNGDYVVYSCEGEECQYFNPQCTVIPDDSNKKGIVVYPRQADLGILRFRLLAPSDDPENSCLGLSPDTNPAWIVETDSSQGAVVDW